VETQRQGHDVEMTCTTRTTKSTTYQVARKVMNLMIVSEMVVRTLFVVDDV
jgi:hypothetical protein